MKDIILLHGALGTKEQMNPIAVSLKDKFNVYSFNFEGHGGSNYNDELSMTRFALMIKQFITDHQLEKPYIFGYSMGGYAALKLASMQQDLLGNIITLGTKLNWSKESLKSMMDMFNPDVIEVKVPKLAMGLAKIHGENKWKSLVVRTGEMLKNLSSKEFISDIEFSGIQNNVILGIGDLDSTVSIVETERVNGLLPNSSVKVLKDIPHELHKADLDTLTTLFN